MEALGLFLKVLGDSGDMTAPMARIRSVQLCSSGWCRTVLNVGSLAHLLPAPTCLPPVPVLCSGALGIPPQLSFSRAQPWEEGLELVAAVAH